MEAIKRRAAQLMGVSVADLPINKAAKAAEQLMKANPPPVDHSKNAQAKQTNIDQAQTSDDGEGELKEVVPWKEEIVAGTE